MGTTPDSYFEEVGRARQEYLAEVAVLKTELETARSEAERQYVIKQKAAAERERQKIAAAQRARNDEMGTRLPPPRRHIGGILPKRRA